MKTLLKIAWRNLLRNKRRTLITTSAIFFAVFLTVSMRSMQIGTYDMNIDRSLDMFNSYLQIQKDGFQETQGIRKAFALDDTAMAQLANINNYKASSPRIIGGGLIGKGDKSVGIAIFGINPETENQTSLLHERIKEGHWIDDSKITDIVVGYKMLNSLNAQIGDTVVILVNAYDGSMGNMKFRIGGTFGLGQEEFDKMSCIMNIKSADELFSMYGKYNAIAIRLNHADDATIAKTEVQKIIKGNDEIVVLDWQELMPELMQSIAIDDAGGIILLGILVMIVAFGVLNTITMSITERYNEFGVMLAIGTKKSFLMGAVLIETLIMSLGGIILGIIPGYILSWYFNQYPLEMSGDWGEVSASTGFVPTITCSIDPMIFINISLLILGTVLFVFIFPALKLRKLEALKGIRYT